MEDSIPVECTNPSEPTADPGQEAYELPIRHSEDGPGVFRALFEDPGDLWQSGTLQCYYSRWKALLEHHFAEAPSEYKAIGGTRCSGLNISFADFLPMAIDVCNELSRGEVVNLTELAESLVNEDLVTRDAARFPHIKQLVFATLGWVSMLYVPSKDYIDGNLAIQVRSGSINSRRLHTWVRPEQAMESITGSLRDVLRDFSNDIRGPLSCIRDTAGPAEMDVLKATNLNFFVLAKLGGLRIIWVDSICMHLELDRREKAVMIFQHPSICALMCSAGDKGMYLDKAATRGLANDSLLVRLCCADCTQEPLYDEIGAPDVRSVYSAQHDFPFFGDRLIALQEYVRLIEPMDLRALYYDRRDLARFMSVWTTIVFGAITLLLATLGVFLAAGQIGTTFKPD
ncbi:hypothetical protein NW762_006377 [Fusarium torreyae]|uniref:Uncharacterized protein n=1 Tax=Fusarium torreyae TaxID=1237075 RepID=A0A9W8S400_9HYPO|nr:hypothetical protein NW762_006377 [Fusarium torreyae]